MELVVIVTTSSTVTSAAMTMILLSMRALTIGTQQWRRPFLLNHVLRQTPENNADTTFSVLLIRMKCIDTMLYGSYRYSCASFHVIAKQETHSTQHTFQRMLASRPNEKTPLLVCGKYKRTLSPSCCGVARIKASSRVAPNETPTVIFCVLAR